MKTLKRLVVGSVFSLALLGGVQSASATVLTVEHTAAVLAEVVYEDANFIVVKLDGCILVIRKDAA